MTLNLCNRKPKCCKKN